MVLPFLPFAPISLPMVPLVIKLVQMLPTNGTIGEPRAHATIANPTETEQSHKDVLKQRLMGMDLNRF